MEKIQIVLFRDALSVIPETETDKLIIVKFFDRETDVFFTLFNILAFFFCGYPA